MLVDSHTHLEIVDDLENSLKRAKEAEVGKIITIGTSLESSKKAIEIADSTSLKLRGAKENFPEIFATCGLHPKDAKSEIKRLHYNDILKSLKSLALSSKKVVGLGECGLDYYSDTTNDDKNFQRELFEAQIKIAVDLNLPLVIHCRNGWDEIFELLKTTINYSSSETKGRMEKFSTSSNNKVLNLRGIFHSFTGGWNTAQKVIDLGFYISFSGIVTFKNAKEIQAVAKKIPLDRILIETDSPFLSPEPLRGKQNEPKNVRIIAEFLAHLRNQPINTIIGASADNVKRLFGI